MLIEINQHDIQVLETFEPKRAAALVELGIAKDEIIFAIRGKTAQRLRDATEVEPKRSTTKEVREE